MTETTPDYAVLIERLEKVEPDTPGEGVTRYYRNPDGPGAAAALRTLLSRAEAAEARVKELELMLRSANSIQQKTSTSMTDWVRRAEAAEAKLAEAMKVIGQIDTALNDQFAAGIEEREGGSARKQERLMKSGEELRRAARKFLKENGNGE